MRHHLPAACLLTCLLAVVALATGCDDGADPALVEALTEGTAAAGTSLYAPSLAGDQPRSFAFHASDHSVTLDYGKGFTPSLTLRTARPGDLCAGREPEWDQCTVLDADAVRLSFEEMDAVVVRRDGTELVWSNISFEVPDEDFASEQEMQAAIAEKVTGFVDAAREADALTPTEFLRAVPRGSVTTSD